MEGLVSKKKILLLIMLPIGFFLLSLFLGRYHMSPLEVIQVLVAKVSPYQHNLPDTIEAIVMNVRLPRALLAAFIGAALSISGASFQGIFSNPLVSPDILGVSAASGFGAALAILLDQNTAVIQLSAFFFGILGVGIAYAISRVYKTTPTLMLVLAGVIVGALFGALTSATKYLADTESKLPAITFWLMGSLATASWRDVVKAVPPIILGTSVLMMLRWRINLLSMGDAEARSLGVRTELMKGIIIVSTTLVTAASVCVSGVIGWIGLIMPHVARMLVGPDHKVLMPASMVVGACYLLLIDDIARTVTAAEIPLGILTSIVGAPFFAYLLRKTKGGWK
jgi:iron complex transport system permease protein